MKLETIAYHKDWKQGEAAYLALPKANKINLPATLILKVLISEI